MALLALSALFGVGCGGIRASQSVSPASFFLPGLLKAEPAQTNAPFALAPVKNPVAVASAR